MNENFATKTDLQSGLKDLEHRMDNRFQVLTQVVESKFQAVDARFMAIDSKFQEMEYKLTIKLETMMVVAVGLTATLIQLIK